MGTISVGLASAIAVVATSAPTVNLDKAAVIGTTNGSVTSYFGIPFAEAPLPRAITTYSGTINATAPATQCPQLPPSFAKNLPAEIQKDLLIYATSGFSQTVAAPESEDCLSISVQVPSGTPADAQLPVLVVSGFTTGSTAQNPGDAIIQRSVELKKPMIYVNINYRCVHRPIRFKALGFLGGKETYMKTLTSLERVGLRWIQKYISAFGGDPEKVTIWGVSAGAISVGLQMVTNGGNTEGLFRGAVMNAGSPLPTGDIEIQQPAYDTVVQHSGCAGSEDTLECLRSVPLDTLMAASANVPNLFEYPGLAEIWAPRADGLFLEAPPQHLVLAGSVAGIPFITGDSVDEGTIFATGSFNVTTDDEFREFIRQHFFPHLTLADLAPLFALYPNDPTAGSPFGTGDANQLSPEFKRMAAIQGDIVFQAPRRFFLDQRSLKQPTWSYMPHGSDFVPIISKGNDLADYIIQFTNTLDPNGASDRTIQWPQYDPVARQALVLAQDDVPLKITRDAARLEAMVGLTAYTIAHPV
ncbi:carotenoid ester lipase [Trametes maxima]|nr:carotenoid ester lipase [Trametes maxima]